MKGDKAIRDAFLDKDLGSPIAHDRIDPVGSPSRQVGGINPSVFYNALWKTVGDGQSGFYESFYKNMKFVSTGLAGADKSDTSLSANSLHQGLVRLGIEVARDGIDRSGSGDVLKADSQSLNFYGDISKGYVKLDLGHISDLRTYALPPSSNPAIVRPAGIYGVDEIDQWVGNKILQSVNLTENSAFHSLMGWTPDNINAGIFRTNSPWSKVVVQAGDGKELNYTDEDSENTLAIGGNGYNTIHSGSGIDILIGGNAGNTFWGSVGADKIVGGMGLDSVDYSESTAGITIDLSNRVDGSDASVQQGGFAQGDILINIEKATGASAHSNSFKGTAAHEEFLGGTKSDTFKLTAGVDKFIGGLAGDTSDTKDVIDVSGYIQAENLPARGFDIDLRAGTVRDRLADTNPTPGPILAELVGLDGAVGSIYEDRFVALETGGTFDGGLNWDTLYLPKSWAYYSFQYDYPGYECRIYDVSGNECLVNSVESFVFGGLSIGSVGQRLSFQSLANLAPSEIFLGRGKADTNVATVVYNDEPALAGSRAGNVWTDQDGDHAKMNVMQPELSDYVRESASVQSGTSQARQLIGHVSVFDQNKFDVVNVKLDARSLPYFELDNDGFLYLKAGVSLDYSAWKANTDARIAGITMSDPIGQGILNSLGNEIAAQLGEKYVARLIATDAHGNSVANQIVYKIEQKPNSAPEQIALSEKYIPSWAVNFPWSYRIGSLSAVDADGDTISWSVPTGTDKPFALNGSDLMLTNPGALVLGSDGFYHVTVTASDGKAQVATDIAIKINTAPSIVFELPQSISDLTAVGSTIGHMTVVDPDSGQNPQSYFWSPYVKLVGNEIVLAKPLDASMTPRIDFGSAAYDGMDGSNLYGSIAVTAGNAQPGDPSAFGFQAAIVEVTERADLDSGPANRADIKVGTVSTPSGFEGRIEIRFDDTATDNNTFEMRNGNELWIKGDARLDREPLGPDGMLKFHLIATDTSGAVPTRTEIPTQALRVIGVDEGFWGMFVEGGTLDPSLGSVAQASVYVSEPDIHDRFQMSILSGGDFLEFVPSPNGYTVASGMPQIRLKEGAVFQSDTLEATFGLTEANGNSHEMTHTFSVIRQATPSPLSAEFVLMKEDLNYSSDTSQPIHLGWISVNSTPDETLTASIGGYGAQVFDVVHAQHGMWGVYLKAGISTLDAHRAAMAAGQGDFPFLMSDITFTAGPNRQATTSVAVHMGSPPEAFLDWQRPLYDMNITANHPDGKELGRIEIFNDSPYSTYELVGDIAQHVWMSKEGNYLVFDWIAGQTYGPDAYENIMGNVRIHNSWNDRYTDSYLNVFVHDVQPAQPISVYLTPLGEVQVTGLMSEGQKVADIHLQGEGSGEYAFSLDGYGDQVFNVKQDVNGAWGLYLRSDVSMAQIHQTMKTPEGWYDYALRTNVTVQDTVRGTNSSSNVQIALGNPPYEQIDFSTIQFDSNVEASTAAGTIIGRISTIGASPFITYELTGELTQRVSMVEESNGDLVFKWTGQSGPIVPDLAGSLRITDSWWDYSYDATYLSVHVDAPTVSASNVASLSYTTDPSQHVKVADLEMADWSGDVSISFSGYGSQVLDAIQDPNGNWGIYLKDNLTMDQVHRAMKLGEGLWDYALNTSVNVRDNITGIEVATPISASVANPNYFSFDMTKWSYDGNIHYNAPNGAVLGSVPLSPGQGWSFSLGGDLADNMALSMVNGKLQINWLPGQSFAYPDNTYETGAIVATSSWWDTSYEVKNFSYMITPFEAPSDIRLSTNFYQNASNISATSSSGNVYLATVFLDGIGWWNQTRESNIHLTTDNPSIFKLTLDSVSYIEKLSIKEGAALMPGRTYSTTLTAWDSMFPDVAPVTETVSFQVKDATVSLGGASGDWGSYLVGTLGTNDPFDSRNMNGGADQYYYSIVGGRDDIFDIVGNKLVAPNGMNSQTDGDALIQILTESNYGFSRVDTYSVDIAYYYGAYHQIQHIG